MMKKKTGFTSCLVYYNFNEYYFPRVVRPIIYFNFIATRNEQVQCIYYAYNMLLFLNNALNIDGQASCGYRISFTIRRFVSILYYTYQMEGGI